MEITLFPLQTWFKLIHLKTGPLLLKTLGQGPYAPSGEVFCLQTKIGITSGFIHHSKVPQRDRQESKSSTSGLARPCSFCKVIGLAVQFDVNIFVTDSKAAAVKLLTTVSGTKVFLKNLDNLLSSAGVHLRNEPRPEMAIRKSLSLVQGVHSYLVSNEERIRLLTNSKCTSLYGPQGNVADKTVNSVKLLAEAHTNLIKTVSSINQAYLTKINVNTLSTDHIECLHSFSHTRGSQ